MYTPSAMAVMAKPMGFMRKSLLSHTNADPTILSGPPSASATRTNPDTAIIALPSAKPSTPKMATAPSKTTVHLAMLAASSGFALIHSPNLRTNLIRSGNCFFNSGNKISAAVCFNSSTLIFNSSNCFLDVSMRSFQSASIMPDAVCAPRLMAAICLLFAIAGRMKLMACISRNKSPNA